MLDGSGQPAGESGARDLRHLAASAERRPLVVVRRDRPLPGRAPYREVTRHEESRNQRQDGGKAAFGAAADTSIGANSSTGGSRETSKAQREGLCDGDEGFDGVRQRARHAGDFDTTAEKAGDYVEDTDPPGSPSGDVYRNVSVILAGPPLETLSPDVQDSGDSGESAEDTEDSQDSGEESVDDQEFRDEACLEKLDWNALMANGSVDSITNCNVVNAVGQNRRLEKQRARGLPPGGNKENQAPTDGVKDEKFYSQFPLMKEVARKGDLIAFKVSYTAVRFQLLVGLRIAMFIIFAIMSK